MQLATSPPRRSLDWSNSHALQVETADGRQTLSMLPQKFNKKLWVKRGGFVLVEEGGPEAEAAGKVTCSIVQVLYEDQVKALKRMQGAW